MSRSQRYARRAVTEHVCGDYCEPPNHVNDDGSIFMYEGEFPGNYGEDVIPESLQGQDIQDARPFNLFDVLRGMAGRNVAFGPAPSGFNLASYAYPLSFAGLQAGQVLEFRSNDEQSQSLTLTLEVIPTGPDPHSGNIAFALEWGSGGATFATLIDGFPGIRIPICASYLRVSVVAVEAALVGTYQCSASLAYLPSVGVKGNPRVTDSPFAASPLTFNLPPFASFVTPLKGTLADVWTVDFLQPGGAVLYSFSLPAGSQGTPLPIGGNITGVRLTRTVGVGTIMMVWDLAL